MNTYVECETPSKGALVHIQAAGQLDAGFPPLGAISIEVAAAIASQPAALGPVCTVVLRTQKAFLDPAFVQNLQGVAGIKARALAERGIRTLQELRQIPKPVLMSVFGEVPGRQLWHVARGLDPNPQVRRKLNWFPRRNPSAQSTRSHLSGVRRLFGSLRTAIAALDGVLGRILLVRTEEVPPRTTPLP